jgi:DNA-directed RNA polymerase subunit RPC12/RpoP
MTIDFTCQKCEGSFELDVQDMVDGTEKLECPHCGVKAPQTQVDDFIAAFTEMQAQVTALGKRFAVVMSIETDEVDDDDDDEDEDEDEDDDDDDIDEDDDDVDEDEEDLAEDDAEEP